MRTQICECGIYKYLSSPLDGVLTRNFYYTSHTANPKFFRGFTAKWALAFNGISYKSPQHLWICRRSVAKAKYKNSSNGDIYRLHIYRSVYIFTYLLVTHADFFYAFVNLPINREVRQSK